MRILPLLALFGILGGVGANAESALRWERKTVEAHTGPVDKTAHAAFAFTNISQQPATIDSVKSSCGCTTAALEKKTYAPGEKGHITAIFTPGSRQGTQVKAIRVNVKGESEPTILTMVTQVGEAVQIQPPLVFWKPGEARQSKTIAIKIPPSAGLRVVKVQSGNPQIAAKLETVKEGAEYQITVTPGEVKAPAMAVLKIQGLTRSNEPKEFQAYAQVK